MKKTIDLIEFKNNKSLMKFIYEVIFLAEQSQVDGRIILNLHLPALVHNTFDEKFIREAYEEMLVDYKNNVKGF